MVFRRGRKRAKSTRGKDARSLFFGRGRFGTVSSRTRKGLNESGAWPISRRAAAGSRNVKSLQYATCMGGSCRNGLDEINRSNCSVADSRRLERRATLKIFGRKLPAHPSRRAGRRLRQGRSDER